MSDEPSRDMSNLEMATIDELLNEIKSRSVNSLIYLEGVGKDLQYVIGYRGDLIRQWGALDLRIAPYLKEEYEDMMNEAEDNGDDE